MNEADRKEFKEVFALLDERYNTLNEKLDKILESVKRWDQIDKTIQETEIVAKKTTEKQKKKADRIICDVKVFHETDKAVGVKRKEDDKIKWIPKKYIQSTIEFDDGWSEITLTSGGAWISNKPWEVDEYKK